MSPSSSRPRTPPFHGGNRGSNPLGDATLRQISSLKAGFFVAVIYFKLFKINGFAGTVHIDYRVSGFAI